MFWVLTTHGMIMSYIGTEQMLQEAAELFKDSIYFMAEIVPVD